MAKNQITLTKAALAGGAGFLAYQFVYKPWRAAQDAAAIPQPSILPWSGGGGAGVGTPSLTYPQYVGPGPSNLDPGAQVGGVIGTCMHRKGWTQQQCTTRLNALTAAFSAAKAQLAALKSGAASVEVAAQLNLTRQALAAAMTQYNAAVARGDTAAANQIKIAIDGHNADIRDLEARSSSFIASQITKLETAIAGHIADYQALTGVTLA